jgi:heat shock protein HslJ
MQSHRVICKPRHLQVERKWHDAPRNSTCKKNLHEEPAKRRNNRMKNILPIVSLGLVMGLTACGQGEATRAPVMPTVASLAADRAATGVAGQVEGAATNVAGSANMAATGVAGRAEGLATGVAGGADSVATNMAGRAEGVATGVAGGLAGRAAGENVLAGSSWQWVQTQMNNDTLTTPDNAANYTVSFNGDGSVSVQADCNSGAGSTTVDGSSISIGPLVTTTAACPAGSQSDTFLMQLQSARTFIMQDGNLFLDMFADAGTMQFTPLSSTN